MIGPSDIAGVDETTARRVISYASTIAPCLDSLAGEVRLNAIAILSAVAAEVRRRGSRDVQSQRIGTASVTYRDVRSCFPSDDRSALRALCASEGDPPQGAPRGAFPTARPIARIWPEDCE